MDNEFGAFGISTSTKTVAESTLWPDVVIPSAVSIICPDGVFKGMASETCAGTDVAMLLRPTCPPITATCVNVALAGDVTVTDNVVPGLTTAPSVGEVI